MVTEIVNDPPDALNPPAWWVRCHDYGDTWELASKVHATSPKHAVKSWAIEADCDGYYFTESNHSVLLEVVSHENYLTLTKEEKEGLREVDESAVKIYRYVIKGKFEPVYHIKKR